VKVLEATHNECTTAAAPRSRGPCYAIRTGFGIRSAVFLHWEDARRFVDPAGRSSGQWVEYAAFNSIGEAKKYLYEGERTREASGDLAGAESGATVRGVREPIIVHTAEELIAQGPATQSDASETIVTNALANPADPLVDLSEERAKSSRGGDLARQIMAKSDGDPKCSGRKRKSGDGSQHKHNSPGKTNKNPAKKRSTPRKGTAKEDGQSTAKSNVGKSKDGNTLFPVGPSDKSTDKDPNETDEMTSWDCMFERLVAHRAETGTLDVKKSINVELFTWTNAQKRELLHHFQNKPTALSNEQLSKLKKIGYGPGRPGIVRLTGIIDTIAAETKWNAMLEELRAYKERNDGSMVFPEAINSASPKPLRDLKYWVMEQRREHRRLSHGEPSNLTARRLQLLTELGFDLRPQAEKISWEQRLEQLRQFVEKHGHCRPPNKHPELGWFVSKIRTKYRERQEGKTNSLTDKQVRELSALGFVFLAGKTPNFRSKIKKSWQERFE